MCRFPFVNSNEQEASYKKENTENAYQVPDNIQLREHITIF